MTRESLLAAIRGRVADCRTVLDRVMSSYTRTIMALAYSHIHVGA